MNEAADRCEAEGTVTSAYAARAANAAYNAAYYAAHAASAAAVRAVHAVLAIHYIASELGEHILHDFAEEVVQILIQMKSPGCEYLYLTE